MHIRGGSRRTGLLLALALALSVVPGLRAAPAAEAAACQDPVFFAGARGSGESLVDRLGMGGPVYATYLATAARTIGFRAAWTVEPYGVPYPAVSTAQLLGGAGAGDLAAYVGSVQTGAAMLTAKLRAQVATCPGQRVVLAGYSQGAQVVEATLAALSSSPSATDAAVRQRIVGVSLLGSPGFSPADGAGIDYKRGGSDGYQDLPGLFNAVTHRDGPSVLSMAPWVDISRSACLRGDDICNYDGITPAEAAWLLAGAAAVPLHPHLAYVAAGYADMGGQYLARKVRNSVGLDPELPPGAAR